MSNIQPSELTSIYSKAKANLHKKVTVMTSVNNTPQLTYTGYLKAIDPISVSLVLCHVDKDNQRILGNVLILGHVIKELIPCAEPIEIETYTISRIIDRERSALLEKHPYYHRAQLSLDLKSTQKKLLEWFTKYRIPTTTNNIQELIIADCVKIKPPYNHETDYVCPTRVILQRIKYMVDAILAEGET